MSMEARMSLSYVSQEYLFCACAVLGKMALYDGIPIIPYLRSIVKHLPWKIPAYTKCCLCQPLYLNHPWGQRACWCIIRWYALSEHITYWVCTNLIYLFISSFCMNFVFKIKLSQKRNQQTCSNFHTILPMIRNRPANKFSLITQPWHHPGANLCFHIIIHIFITIYHKLIKFNTHKLQVMGQHIDPSTPPCAHVKIKKCSKSQSKQWRARFRSFWAFQNFLSVRVPNFHMIWIPDVIIDNFH